MVERLDLCSFAYPLRLDANEFFADHQQEHPDPEVAG
jgi:hypothetical protein